MIAWYFATMSKWKDVSWEIRKGTKCPSCKEDIYTREEEEKLWVSGQLDFKNDKIITCKSCRRDESIDVLFGEKSNLFIKFRNYLISDKSKKLLIYMMIVLLATIIIDVVCIFSGVKGFSIVTNSVNILYWVVMFMRRRYSSIKKPSR